MPQPADISGPLTDEMVDALAREHGVDLDRLSQLPSLQPLPDVDLDDSSSGDSDEELTGSSNTSMKSSLDLNPSDEVALTAMCIGIVAGVSGLVSIQTMLKQPTPGYWQLPLYITSLSIFHFLEYYITARYNRPKVRATSFLLRNGTTYIAAHALALTEAVLEYYLVPTTSSLYIWTRGTTLTALAGLVILGGGQFLRSAAMIHAATNFSHVIARTHQSKHTLVRSGVYSFSRHPSYSGFFFWALGTQVLLANPLSLMFFAVVLWRFFRERIEDEEQYLLVFFGREYAEYKLSTPTRIPFIT